MVFEKLAEILSQQLEIDISEITLDSELDADLGASSLDLVDLAMNLEDEFGIEVPDELIEKVKTVRDVVDFIEQN